MMFHSFRLDFSDNGIPKRSTAISSRVNFVRGRLIIFAFRRVGNVSLLITKDPEVAFSELIWPEVSLDIWGVILIFLIVPILVWLSEISELESVIPLKVKLLDSE